MIGLAGLDPQKIIYYYFFLVVGKRYLIKKEKYLQAQVN